MRHSYDNEANEVHLGFARLSRPGDRVDASVHETSGWCWVVLEEPCREDEGLPAEEKEGNEGRGSSSGGIYTWIVIPSCAVIVYNIKIFRNFTIYSFRLTWAHHAATVFLRLLFGSGIRANSASQLVPGFVSVGCRLAIPMADGWRRCRAIEGLHLAKARPQDGIT